jgi:hypothetical protein
MSERKDNLLTGIVDRFQKFRNRRQRVDVTLTSVDVKLLQPDPLKDPDGYTRHWLLREEWTMFRDSGVLTSSDLDHEVMEWVRTNYPGSYTTPCLRLHSIKTRWLEATRGQNNIEGWKEVLKDNRWKRLVPRSDFDK